MKETLKTYNRILNGQISWGNIWYEVNEEVSNKLKIILELENNPELVLLPKSNINKKTKWILTPGWRYNLFYKKDWKIIKIKTKHWWYSFSSRRWEEAWFDIIQPDIRVFQKNKKTEKKS